MTTRAQEAAKSLILVYHRTHGGVQEPSKLVNWFWFECCLDFTRVRTAIALPVSCAVTHTYCIATWWLHS
jgi:hypothetical protein